MPGQQSDGAVARTRTRLRRIAAGLGACAVATGLAVGPAQATTAAWFADDSTRYGYTGGGFRSGQGAAAANPGDPATAAESRGVVLIDTALYDGSQAAGTGIVLSSSGTVVTNYHVVEGSTAITATIASSGRSYTARVVGADRKSDIAVLQLRAASGLRPAAIDDDPLAVADTVTAVGNAGGTDTLTAADGKVTALDQTITTQAEAAVAAETLTGMIETDAEVVAGDSGGPLLDSEGEVTGIDTAASSGGAVQGYAIPINRAEAIVRQIESGRASTDVRIGAAAYLGVQVTTARQSAADGSGIGGRGPGNDPQGGGWYTGSDPLGGHAGTSGAAVIGVPAGTPAARSGLTAGDLITRVGSTTIDSAAGLSTALGAYRPGDKVAIGWTDSNGEQHTTTVTLAASPVN